jgi:hypothetical protein
MDTSKDPGRLDYWKLIDRVACSGDVTPPAILVLARLLQHRNTKTGQCNPGIKLLAKRLFPKLSPRTGYEKVARAMKELVNARIMKVDRQFNATSIYKFAFEWGTKNHWRGEIDTSLSDDKIEDGNSDSAETTGTPQDLRVGLRENCGEVDVGTTESDPVKTTDLNNKVNDKRNDKDEIASSIEALDEVSAWDLELERRTSVGLSVRERYTHVHQTHIEHD